MSTNESEDEMLPLDVDPWMRFDMWCNRAWEMTQKATEVVMEIGPHTSDTDERVLALFHAAQVSKEFAQMLNPLNRPAAMQQKSDPDVMIMTPEMLNEILAEDDD
jgi:hypothetical protein